MNWLLGGCFQRLAALFKLFSCNLRPWFKQNEDISSCFTRQNPHEFLEPFSSLGQGFFRPATLNEEKALGTRLLLTRQTPGTGSRCILSCTVGVSHRREPKLEIRALVLYSNLYRGKNNCFVNPKYGQILNKQLLTLLLLQVSLTIVCRTVRFLCRFMAI